MKLASRSSERTLMRKPYEPHYHPWSKWELCEGTEGLTLNECKTFVRHWATAAWEDLAMADVTWGVRTLNTGVEFVDCVFASSRDPYMKEEFLILPDEFNIDNLNQ